LHRTDKPGRPRLMEETEIIHCLGHRNVTALHPTTFEITREEHLTLEGDCIIGIRADRSASGLSPGFRNLLSREGTSLVTCLRCEDLAVLVQSSGNHAMTLDHPSDLVWRKSSFVCGRTVGIGSDLAARDLPRELVALLRQGKELTVEMTVCREPD
jgi:hypothetical protein